MSAGKLGRVIGSVLVLAGVIGGAGAEGIGARYESGAPVASIGDGTSSMLTVALTTPGDEEPAGWEWG